MKLSLVSLLLFLCSRSVFLAPHDLVQPATPVFPLKEGQSSRIYLSEIKRKRSQWGLAGGEIVYPGVNPRMGTQVNRPSDT